MNICLIGPCEGGGATYLRELEHGLKTRGHHVHLIAWGSERKEKDTDWIKLVDMRLLKGIELVVHSTLFILLRHRKENFQVLHAFYAFPSGFTAMICGKIIKRPVVISCVGSDLTILPKNLFYRMLILLTARSAYKIICVGQYLRRIAVSIGIDDQKIVVIPTGVNTEHFDLQLSKEEARRILGLPAISNIILFVGRLVYLKRADRAIRILSKVLEHYHNVLLVLVGDGPMKDQLKELSMNLGVENHVQFKGFVPNSRIPFYYVACDVFVITSDLEGLPTVVLEAMASKRLVIATMVGEIPRVIEDRVNGMLVKPKEEETMVDRIEEVFCSDSKLSPIQEAAFRTAKKYDWKTLTERIESIYIS